MKNQTTVATGHPGLVRSITLYLPLLLLLLFSACRKNETIESAAPVVISTTPDNHAPTLEGPVRLVFNVPMDAASLRQYLVVTSGGQHVPGRIECNGAEVLFYPEQDFKPNTQYEVNVQPEARSAAGILMIADYNFLFTPMEFDQYEMTMTSQQVTDFARDGSRMMQSGNYLYSYGGWANPPEASYNDVYRTSDLVTWQKRPDAPWHGRHVFGIARMNGATYVIGGDNLQPQFDVWRTYDGENWTLLADNILDNRIYFGCTAHEGALYIVGGATYNEVWKSTDGSSWSKIADNLAFLNGENFSGSLASFHGKLWLVCGGGTGGGSGTPRKSVWSSVDGITWTQEQDFAGSARYYTDVCVWDNKLWVVGGYNYDEGNIKSIWYMNQNGVWKELQTPDTYVGRHATGVAVFNNSLVITCGSYHNDCWVIKKIN